MTDDNKKILIVEDEVAVFNALKDKLLINGFEVLEAKNGKEGLSLALKEHPDLILLDIIMPKMGGISMMKNLRSDSWGAKVPIIILTNLNSDDSIIKAIEDNKPSFYLVKSDWNINDVVIKVRELLGMTNK